MRRQARVLPIVLLCCSLVSVRLVQVAAKQAGTGRRAAVKPQESSKEPARQTIVLYDVMSSVRSPAWRGGCSQTMQSLSRGARPYQGDICGRTALWLQPDESRYPCWPGHVHEPQAATQLVGAIHA
jgi:hypothetical protein